MAQNGRRRRRGSRRAICVVCTPPHEQRREEGKKEEWRGSVAFHALRWANLPVRAQSISSARYDEAWA
ncbi:hypothetical protein Q7C36_014184 [Tachysurus vachellii]|uniref:Uncharacterized protein n=1 Tax=Tachysurus vachellii TaxID=175792 RepID=A0AA88MEP8_TACVA|nr:hypothetical protein Q7C36_014184 [Tachysurus vachellii]